MVRKDYVPEFPDSYLGDKSDDYDSQGWMERNQKKTTMRCIEFLYDKKLGKEDIRKDIPYLLLDLGCGTGFSSEVLLEHGFKVVGIDLLYDMLSKMKKKRDNQHLKDLQLILGDANHLPFRSDVFDHILSVSSYNFILHKKTHTKEKKQQANATAKYINIILKKLGRFIIEFYPKDEEELEIFKKSFIYNGFDGFLIKSNPNQKSGQTFLLLKKNDENSDRDAHL